MRSPSLLARPLAVCLALGGLALLGPARAPAPAPRAEPQEWVERVENFVLEREGQSEPAGIVELRRQRLAEGWQLELEVRFRGEGIRVLAVECLARTGARLVWREISPGAGRTVLAEWRDGGRVLRTVEWASDGSLRESFDASRGAVMPLYLIELCRAGLVHRGAHLVFDPLGRDLELQHVHTAYGPDPQGPHPASAESVSADPANADRAGVSGGGPESFVRTVELLRGDGSLAGRYVFRGTELERFQWQAGGLVARRVERVEYEGQLRPILAELEAQRMPDPKEAALEAYRQLTGVKDVSALPRVRGPLVEPGRSRVE